MARDNAVLRMNEALARPARLLAWYSPAYFKRCQRQANLDQVAVTEN
jgi:hypothetical protein